MSPGGIQLGMRPPGTSAELERRRRLAVARVAQGHAAADVAAFLGVRLRSVRRWLADHRADPLYGLQALPHPGRARKLDPAQEATVLAWFDRPPAAFGLAGALWTAAKVAALIDRTFGVRLTPGYLSAWLARRRIRPLLPRRRQKESDPAKVRAWLETGPWPAIRDRVRAGAPLTLIDEAGLLLRPLVRRSLAPKGRPPVVAYRAKHREKVSLIAALTLRPGDSAEPVRLTFRTYPKEYVDGPKAADFVRAVLAELGPAGAGGVVLWDGGPMHKGPAIRALQAEHPGLLVERRPPYSPQTNPVEGLWSWLKYGRLANHTPDSAADLDGTAQEHLREIRGRPDLLQAFFDHCELPLHEVTLAS